MSNLDGLKKDANGILRVKPSDIGPHYNFRIQLLGGGEDQQNWHIQYAEDESNYYVKVFDSVSQRHLSPDGIYKFSKFASSSMEEAMQEKAMWNITTDLSLLNDLPSEDAFSMAAELQSVENTANILNLAEMLIPLAQEAISLGAQGIEYVE